jgi:hypothetical protein
VTSAARGAVAIDSRVQKRFFFRPVMRNTGVFGGFVTAALLIAGCFNPHIVDAGFVCDPADPHPCPDGYFCRDYGSGQFLCTTSFVAPTGNADLAMSSGGGGGGGGGGDVDMAMPAGAQDLATLPPDLTPPPNNCTASSLVINEVRTGSSASAKEEWVEIYNPCANSITLTGKLVYRSDTNNGATDTSTLATITSKSIAGGGYLLIANSGYSGPPAADIATFDSISVGMADGGGGVGLRDAGGTLLTSMGWGTANNTFQQGSAATTEATNQSIARKPNGADTHHDNLDFKSSTPTPRAAN